jgi:hypothetical protein
MALRIVTDASVIQTAQRKLIAAFRKGPAKRIPVSVGYRGGNNLFEVYWDSQLGFWLASETIENSRYWNAFGTEDPTQSKMVSISCEVNFPLSEIDRRIGGAIAEDERGHLFLVHRGKIGGGRQGIGAELFWAQFDGKPTVVFDGERETEVVLLGSVESPRLLKQLQFFVHEVERIKASVSRVPNEVIGTNRQNTFKIQELGEEFEGKKIYSRTSEIVASCDHGIIVNRLRRELKELKYATGRDRLRDLYVHRKGKITSLFEVKTDVSSGSIYAAVGQLFLYSVSLEATPKLVFVAPEELSAKTRNNLNKLGIQILIYKWVNDEPEFSGLADWNF